MDDRGIYSLFREGAVRLCQYAGIHNHFELWRGEREYFTFKANISAVFIADNIFRAILYTALGLLTIDTLKTALLLIPFGLAGLFAGIRCSSRANERIIRMLTAALLVLSGLSLILKNL